MHRLWLIFCTNGHRCGGDYLRGHNLEAGMVGRHPTVIALQEAPITQTSDEKLSPGSFREAARAALPSVILYIYTTQQVRQQKSPLFDDPIFRHFFGERPDGEPRRNSGLGSGVIVSANGYILTNFHVIDSADDIQVSLNDGSTHKAKIIGSDPESDLAILQINSETLPVITFGQMDNLFGLVTLFFCHWQPLWCWTNRYYGHSFSAWPLAFRY